MLEGSDAKTEIVRGLLLPSPTTVSGPGVGGSRLFSPTVGGGEARPSSESRRCGGIARGEGAARAEPSPYLPVG